MIGARLADLRDWNNQTQEELAKALNVATSTIRSWEHEKSSPNHEMLIAICRYYGTSADYLLGLTVAGQMTADKFVRPDTLLIMALGLVAFIFDTAGGVLFAKLLNLFLPEGKKLNPMIGAAGISAFPMSGRVVNKMGLAEDSQNFLLMYSISVNVSGQIASVLAGGLILSLMA